MGEPGAYGWHGGDVGSPRDVGDAGAGRPQGVWRPAGDAGSPGGRRGCGGAEETWGLQAPPGDAWGWHRGCGATDHPLTPPHPPPPAGLLQALGAVRYGHGEGAAEAPGGLGGLKGSPHGRRHPDGTVIPGSTTAPGTATAAATGRDRWQHRTGTAAPGGTAGWHRGDGGWAPPPRVAEPELSPPPAGDGAAVGGGTGMGGAAPTAAPRWGTPPWHRRANSVTVTGIAVTALLCQRCRRDGGRPDGTAVPTLSLQWGHHDGTAVPTLPPGWVSP